MTTKINLTRRGLLATATASTVLAMPGIVRADSNFPNQPIRMLIPWTAGGASDIVMRAISDAASKALGKPVIADNRPGAGGILGAQYVSTQSQPDGYTLTQIPMGALRLPYMNNSATFDPLKDFTYISQLSGYTFGVVVNAASPFKTFQDLLDWAKAHPGELTYGTPGVGTSLHLTMEQIAVDLGLEFLHVPFRGVAENNTALLGQSIMCSADVTGWAPLVADGKFRLLCVWSTERLKQFPDAPTLRECGIDKVITSPFGVAGPKGMDPAVTAKLDAAFNTAMKDPNVLSILERLDLIPDYLNSADYTAAVQRSIATERPVLEKLNLLMQR